MQRRSPSRSLQPRQPQHCRRTWRRRLRRQRRCQLAAQAWPVHQPRLAAPPAACRQPAAPQQRAQRSAEGERRRRVRVRPAASTLPPRQPWRCCRRAPSRRRRACRRASARSCKHTGRRCAAMWRCAVAGREGPGSVGARGRCLFRGSTRPQPVRRCMAGNAGRLVPHASTLARTHAIASLCPPQALRPVERYYVRSMAYRRHLADEAALQHTEVRAAAPPAWAGPRCGVGISCGAGLGQERLLATPAA